ncbi:MAG: hypothetical protein M1834_000392 [Cirrosporium novae-zelandiae]|nr:MAG: hypothetical protein M1834_000392 [Cirrosporium novae-zelandiae]
MLPHIRFHQRLQHAFLSSLRQQTRLLTYTPIPLIKQMPPRPKIDESDITEAFLKGSGPGGQKINKTSSAVQLKHLPTGIVIKSQATRSRTQNRKIARRILAEKVEQMEKGEESRVGVKTKVKQKRKASADKKKRRKYRALEEAKEKLEEEPEVKEGEKDENESRDNGPTS